jgi:hypothetical protein
MKHSNLYLGLVLPSGGWQSLIALATLGDSKQAELFCLHKPKVAKANVHVGCFLANFANVREALILEANANVFKYCMTLGSML